MKWRKTVERLEVITVEKVEREAQRKEGWRRRSRRRVAAVTGGTTGSLSCGSEMPPDRVISHAEVYPDPLEGQELPPFTPTWIFIQMGEGSRPGGGAEWKMVVNYLYSVPSFPLGLLHLWLIWSMSLFSLAFIYGMFRASGALAKKCREVHRWEPLLLFTPDAFFQCV